MPDCFRHQQRLARVATLTAPVLLERVAFPLVWDTMSAALAAVLERGTTWPLRLLAEHARELRHQTVLEAHVERLLAPFWAYPPATAARSAGRTLAGTVRPVVDDALAAGARRFRRG